MQTTHIVEIIAASTMLIALVGMYCNRWQRTKLTLPQPNQQNSPKLSGGIGARAIQFITVAFLLPIILILALENKIDTPVIGTLLGAIAGYLLSAIGAYDLKN